MGLIVVWQHERRARARIEQALGGHFRLFFPERWVEVVDALARHRADALLVDISDPFHPLPTRRLRALRRRHPHLAILVHSVLEGRVAEIFELAKTTIDGVIAVGDDPSARELRRTVERAVAGSLAARLTAPLDGRLPDPAREVLRWAVAHAHESPSVQELAAALGETPETLGRRLRNEGFATQRRLLLWGRLMRAAAMLSAGDATVDEVALRLGYSTGTALRRAFRRTIGRTPSEVSARGGAVSVRQAFLEQEVFPRMRKRKRRSR